MVECRSCKSYKKCNGKPWYSYLDLRFCPHQVIWVIENSATLLAGKWPPNPEGSGYIDPGIKTGYKSEAYYVKPVGILAEVEYRLKRCGVYGKLLRAEVLAGLELSPEAKSALHYCKGWRRKRMTYQRWLWDRRYQGKKLRKTTVL